ncbi:hypothetical protein diail_8827 [Diaporthe ilicicola]|nr:hypothetical protein diail_8827 [Diaporthe ilicicola]
MAALFDNLMGLLENPLRPSLPTAQPPQTNLPTVPNSSGVPAQPGGGPQQVLPPLPIRSPGTQALADTGIFNGIPDTPTPTNPHTIAELQQMVHTAEDESALLSSLRTRVDTARGGQSVRQRKDAMRRRLRPWIRSGHEYTGPRREGLFLADGSPNPARRRRRGARPAPPIQVLQGQAPQ